MKKNLRNTGRPLSPDSSSASAAAPAAPAGGPQLRHLLRLEDPLCRHFLSLGRSPDEREGLRILYPFVREAVRLEIPRAHDLVYKWFYAGLLAGFHLGTREPHWVDVILPQSELHRAEYLLDCLQCRDDAPRATLTAVQRASFRYARAVWDSLPEGGIDELYATVALRALRAGFAAAVLAPNTVGRGDYWGSLPLADGWAELPAWSRHWTATPVEALHQPLDRAVEHPLLSIARPDYLQYPEEGRVVRRFLRRQLRQARVRGDAPLAVTRRVYVDWVRASLAEGIRLQREEPALVQAILARRGDASNQEARATVCEVVAEAGGLDPRRLLVPLLRWDSSWDQGGNEFFAAKRWNRLVKFVDFGLWTPWVMRLPAPADGLAC
ncbi:MAG: hypothetical protein RJA22_2172 [Verrucomicrobiota bacterium]